MTVCPACSAELASGAKFCAECGTRIQPAATSASESRRVVTVLFSDVTGSTALGEQLDPEAVRALMGRYFVAMKAVIERHGGTVEKFIGDAIMAVFGIPTLHEDDALRAVRAAAQMREALAALNTELATERGVTIQTRTGITTGEVVAGDPSAGQTLVTGDTVNTAARLEQAAAPGEILIGEPTWRLVRDAVSAESVAAISAKGKALPVPAYRLGSVVAGAEGHARRLDAPLVGRERELARLTQSYSDAVSQRRCELFTLLGAAGVGKSRLVREFLAAVGDEARILRGHCLPYGQGITYWPLAEALKGAAQIDERDNRATAQHKLLVLLDGERDAELLAGRLATAIGLSDDPAPQTELFWAVRRTLEHLARQRPLVVVWEDIHWAEPTFLDLIDHLADWSRDAPLFVLAPARPELLDARPGWGGGKLNASIILLEALPAEAAARLIDALPGGAELPEALRTRIASAAEGNPLFVEELLAMLIDDGVLQLVDGRWRASGDLEQLAIPPTISALLAARLGRLSAGERHVAERASVVGRIFEPEAVAALSADRADGALGEQLMALVRKELVRPDRSEVTGGDAFKFRHILIRDAAYESLPKRERADLHERFAAWLESASGDRVAEFGEIIGHHLEQAYRYQVELGGSPSVALGERAAGWLSAAAGRASERFDWAAAAVLFSHAAEVAAAGDGRLGMKEQAAWCLRYAGEFGEAGNAAHALAREAELEGNEAVALRAGLLAADVVTFLDAAAIPRLNELVTRTLPRLQELGDARGVAQAYFVEAFLHDAALRCDQAHSAYRLALLQAIDAGWRQGAMVANSMRVAAHFGATPIADARAEAVELRTQLGTAWDATEAEALDAVLEILLRGYRDAKPNVLRARHLLEEVGDGVSLSYHPMGWAMAALATGDAPVALSLSAEAERALRLADNDYNRRTAAAVLAESLTLLDRLDEAEAHLAYAREADPSDLLTHVSVQRTAARMALARGDIAEAERSATEASRLLEGAEAPLEQAQVLIVWSEVYTAMGAPDRARDALTRARTLMVHKGADAVVRRIDTLMMP